MNDIKLTANGDIDLSNGDIAYTESTRQHERDLIITQKGHYKESPAVGVGALEYIHEENPDNFLRAVRKELTRDGMKVIKINLNNGELNINANYPDE